MSFRVKVSRKIVGVRLNERGTREVSRIPETSDTEELEPDRREEVQDYSMLLARIRELEEQLAKAGEMYFKAGYEEGIKVGRYEVRREMEALREQLQKNIASLKEQFDRIIESLEEPLTAFAMKVAEKVIHQEVDERGREIIRRKLGILLKKLTDQAKILIRLNPDVVRNFGDVKELGSVPTQKIAIIEDESLAPGDCVVETDNYIIEGTIKRELENIEAELSRGRE